MTACGRRGGPALMRHEACTQRNLVAPGRGVVDGPTDDNDDSPGGQSWGDLAVVRPSSRARELRRRIDSPNMTASRSAEAR
jgi:hypothetical protein